MAKNNITFNISTKINEAVVKKIKEMGEKELRVGFLSSKSMDYKDGTSVVQVAVQNEFGGSVDTTSLQKKADKRSKEIGRKLVVPNPMQIPARPFFRNAMDKNRNKYALLVKSYLNDRGMAKGRDSKTFLNMLGNVMQLDVMKSIDDTHTPENSDLTVIIKQSNHPLIDTGHMRQSVSWEVKDKNGETDS